MASSDWLMRLPGPARPMQLFCFPYAGGNAAAFLPWQARLAQHIELVAVQLPGRAQRLAEPPLHDIERLLDALVDVMAEQAKPPFAFFGHSLGGLVAFELARRLRRNGMPLPEHLFVSASTAPQQRRPLRPLHLIDDEALIDALRAYNGTPPEALEHRELMALLLPSIRADWALLYGYRHRQEPPLHLPITVLAGAHDPHVSPEHLAGWQACTTHPCELHEFDGDHFFLRAQADAVVGCINGALHKHQNTETERPACVVGNLPQGLAEPLREAIAEK